MSPIFASLRSCPEKLQAWVGGRSRATGHRGAVGGGFGRNAGRQAVDNRAVGNQTGPVPKVTSGLNFSAPYLEAPPGPALSVCLSGSEALNGRVTAPLLRARAKSRFPGGTFPDSAQVASLSVNGGLPIQVIKIAGTSRSPATGLKQPGMVYEEAINTHTLYVVPNGWGPLVKGYLEAQDRKLPRSERASDSQGYNSFQVETPSGLVAAGESDLVRELESGLKKR